jgi:PAS domain S-box-containing protein
MASVVKKYKGAEFDHYGGVIITRIDRRDIRTLSDLKGQVFAAVDEDSLGGWLAAVEEFQRKGFDPRKDFAKKEFLGSNEAVVSAVLNGRADAGVLETGVLERMQAAGKISFEDFKVLNRKEFYENYEGESQKIPFLSSTELFPEWSIAQMPHMEERVAKQVTRALFEIQGDHPAAVAAGCSQWVVPHNLTNVRQYLYGIGYFGKDADSWHFWEGFREILKAHWSLFILFLLVLTYLAFSLVNRLLLTRHLRNSQKILEQQLEERSRAEEALRQSQKMLQLVLDTLPSRVFWKDRASSFLGCNTAFARDCGYEVPGDIIGKSDHDMPWSKEQSEHYRSDDEFVMTTKRQKLDIHEPQTRSDGHTGWLRTNKVPLLNDKGDVIGILGTYEDVTEQRRAHEALKASEAKYRELVEYANSIIIRILPNGAISFFNEFAQSFFGFKEEEAIGKTVFQTILPSDGIDQNEFQEILEDIRVHPEAYSWHENENVKKDGSRVWVSWSNRGVFNDKGEMIEILCVGTDMTDRRTMEIELRKLSHALEQSQNVVIISDTQGNIEYVNPKFIEVTGYSREEAIGKNPRILKSGEQSEDIYKELWTTIKEGGTWRGEFHNRKKNGDLFWQRTTVSVIRNKEGDIVHYLSINEDITKEKELAQELQKAFERLKEMERIINLSNAILFLWKDTPDWEMDFVSDNVNHWGYQPEEFYKRKMNLKGIVHPEDLIFLEEEVRRAVSKKRSELFVQHRVRTRAEEFRWVENYTWITYDKSGRVKRFQTVAFDITERKIAEDRMLEAINIKSEFISVVSHELRTPLTAIKEGINIVVEEEAGALNDRQKEFLGIAKRNVDRLGALINDVLDYQKLDSGRTQFHWSVGSVRPVIEEVARSMTVVAQNRGLQLRTVIGDNLQDVNYDYDRIIQVLNNLVNNAIKFTQKGFVEIVAENDAEGVKVSVKDTGVGIRSEDLHRLFQTFSQVSSGSNRRTGESGLGLAISKRIIDLHGGRIWVNSIFGEGSVFSFVLPPTK